MKIKFISAIFLCIALSAFSQTDLNIPITPSKDQELDRAAGYSRTLSNFDGSIKNNEIKDKSQARKSIAGNAFQSILRE